MAYLSVQKWFSRDFLCRVKIWPKDQPPSKNADFQSVFARSASAVTPSEKSSVRTRSSLRVRAFQ